MGLLEEKEAMWKKAEERAKALEEKEKQIKEAAKSVNEAKTEDDAIAAAKKLRSAYDGYKEAEKETKKGGLFDFIRKILKL